MNKIISCFYNYLKNSSRRLKVVCDWDEVIQSSEPFSLYLSLEEESKVPIELEKLVSRVKVYSACSQIPKGNVSTYKLISLYVYGSVNFARRVGSILKHCPCSLPVGMANSSEYQCSFSCYRVIRSNFHVGELIDDNGQSRIDIKTDKLKKEGVKLDEKGYLIKNESMFKDFTETEKINWKILFEHFWQSPFIDYSLYGSRLLFDLPEQANKKNHPRFYQSAPFLSLAKELLMLVKENKVEVVFLSAFDKEIFSDGDPRKKKIFASTFGNFSNCSLKLIGFKWGEEQKTKGEWIKENLPDCDVLLDDNPNILDDALTKNPNLTVIAPYYPIVRHHKKVLLFKNSLSNLRKKDFEKVS